MISEVGLFFSSFFKLHFFQILKIRSKISQKHRQKQKFSLVFTNVFKKCVCRWCVFVYHICAPPSHSYSHLILHTNSNTKAPLVTHTPTSLSYPSSLTPRSHLDCGRCWLPWKRSLFLRLEANGQVWLLIGRLGWRAEARLCMCRRVLSVISFKGDMLLEATESIRHTRRRRRCYHVNVSLCVTRCFLSHLSSTPGRIVIALFSGVAAVEEQFEAAAVWWCNHLHICNY